MDNENDNGEVLTAEQVEQLKADLEAEKVKVDTAVAEATRPLTDRIASLEQDLQAKDADLKAGDEELSTVKMQLNDLALLAGERDVAITAYKALVQKTNPVVPREMITGSTVADINASLEQANQFVSHIRTKVEEEINKNMVPAGAPGRTEPDISAMSTREKISYGLQKTKKGS